MLFTDYGIASLADLERAIAAGALAGVPRLGRKTLENWQPRHSRLSGPATPHAASASPDFAYEAMAYLRDGPPLEKLCYAGSLRR